jgi:hypothetical protein
MKRRTGHTDELAWNAVVWKMKLRFDALYKGGRARYPSWEEFFPPDAGSWPRRADAEEVIRCTRATFERCLLLMNDVCLAAERLGFAVSMGYHCTRMELLRDGAPLWLRIIEKSVLSNSNESEGASRAIGRHGRVGTGRIELVITKYGGGSTTFRDREGLGLDHQIEDVINAIQRLHVGALACKARMDASMRESEQYTRERKLEEARRAAEEKRREDLMRSAAEWNNALQIRAYISEFRQRVVDNRMTPSDEFEAWCEWALAVADELERNTMAVTRIG